MGKAEGPGNIFELIWKITGFIFIISLPSFLILIHYKKLKELLSLIILSLVIPVFHLALNRQQTLNKHLYLTVIFLSVIAAYGISILLFSKIKLTRLITALSFTFVVFLYIVISQKTLNGLQTQWKNTNDLQIFLRQNVKSGDKVLTENGGAVILSLYDITFPPNNIVTFDWINYSNLSDERGYIQAVRDIYFDYIELDGQFEGENNLGTIIRNEMAKNYRLIYNRNDFEVYGKQVN
jgi:hypothetical protein